MSLLANLKLRRKLLLAIAPLAIMVIVAGVYCSIRSKMIDTWYSMLIENQVKGVVGLDNARVYSLRYIVALYRVVLENNPDRRQVIDGRLDSDYSEYKKNIAEAIRRAPAWAPQITATAGNFDKAVLSSRAVRAAALANDTTKAAALLHSGLDTELEESREHFAAMAEELQKVVDQRSDELTDKTHRSILVTWIVIALGMLVTFGIVFYALQVDVVQELFDLRDSIRSIAAGKLDRPIPFLNRRNEIGEISRSLETLQGSAKERETLSWVKAEVAATGVRLQSAENISAFAAALLSRISESITLFYGSFYLIDDSRSRLCRAGTFAIEGRADSSEFALGEGLVGQAALERRTLDLCSTDADPVLVSTGVGTVAPRRLLFVPVLAEDLVIGVIELATGWRVR